MRFTTAFFALTCLLWLCAPAWCQPSPLDRLDPGELAPDDRAAFPPSAVALIPQAKGSLIIDTAFSADGKRLACARTDNTVEFWDLSGAKPRQRNVVKIEDDAGRVSRVAFSRDGAWIASAHGFPAKKVRIWKWTEDDVRPAAEHEVKRCDNLAFHPNGKMLVFGSNEGHVMELTDKGPVYRGDKFPNANSCFTFTRDGASFVSVVFNPARNGELYGSELKFWRVADNTEQRLLQQARFIKALALSPDGKTLATTTVDLTIRIWDLSAEPPTSIVPFTRANGVKAMFFTPDSERLIVVGNANEIALWNVKKGRQEAAWRFTSQSKIPGVYNVGFAAAALAPDGRHLAISMNSPGTVILRLPDPGEKKRD